MNKILSLSVLFLFFIPPSFLCAQSSLGADFSLEDSLLDLKQNAQEIIENNKQISAKIENLKARIPQLKEQLDLIQKEGSDVVRENQALKEKINATDHKKGSAQENIQKMTDEQVELKNIQANLSSRLLKQTSIKLKLQSEVEVLRNQISNMKLDFDRVSKHRQEGLEKEKNTYRQLIQEKENKNKLSKAEVNTLRGQTAQAQKELDALKNDHNLRQDRFVASQADRDAIVQQNKMLEDKLSSLNDKDLERDLQLNTEIEGLKTLRGEFETVLKDWKNKKEAMQAKDKSERSQMAQVKEQLKDQKEMLLGQISQLEKVLALRDAHNAEENPLIQAVSALEEKKTVLVDDYENRKKFITENEAKTEALQKVHVQLKKDIEDIKKVKNASQSDKDMLLKKQEADYVRQIKAQENTVGQSRNRLNLVQKDLVSSQQDLSNQKEIMAQFEQQLASLDSEINQALQGQAKSQEELDLSDQEYAKLMNETNSEIEELKLYSQELTTLLGDVKEKLKQQDPALFKPTQDIKLKTHHDKLVEENQLLQQKFLTLSTTLDRLKGKSPKSNI
ncbi:MAG: hypothetical protein A2Z88_03200 [Omnitrophica WOR_2 bacterium GWA2_47_8]|nr:MAG: hypothetical protein A2Z88_03200 [Omnitrophica WOR_2 bacterium GWA2_47_8]